MQYDTFTSVQRCKEMPSYSSSNMTKMTERWALWGWFTFLSVQPMATGLFEPNFSQYKGKKPDLVFLWPISQRYTMLAFSRLLRHMWRKSFDVTRSYDKTMGPSLRLYLRETSWTWLHGLSQDKIGNYSWKLIKDKDLTFLFRFGPWYDEVGTQ